MSRLTFIVLVHVVLFPMVASPSVVAANDGAMIDRARTLWNLLHDRKFAEFWAEGNEQFKNILPPDRLQESWEAVLQTYGNPERELGVNVVPAGELSTVELKTKFNHATVVVRIALHKDGKVAGLFFVPAQEGEYKPPSYGHPSNFREEEVVVKSGSFELPGTLTFPKGEPVAPGFPAVVLVHGSGPHDRDETVFVNKPFKDIAAGLATRGVAVLRYEKRTLKYGASIDVKTLTLDAETVDDAVAAVRLLFTRSDIDSKRVFVLGHSLGGMAAPFIAEKEPKIAGIIMLAAAARKLTVLVDEQIDYIAAADGKVEEAERKANDEIHAKTKAIRDGTFKPGEMLLGAPVEYWDRLERMDPVAAVKKLSIPVLIGQGARDYQVSAEKDLELWRKELSEKTNVTIKLFPFLDHLLRKGEGRTSTPQEYQKPGNVHQGIVVYVSEWINNHSPKP